MDRPSSSLDWVLSHWAHFTVLRFIFVYVYMCICSVNRNIVRYNKYLVVVNVVVVFVRYCYSYCDLVRTLYSRCWCVQVLVRYLFYF